MRNSVILSAEAKRLRKKLLSEYGIADAGGKLLVETVCESFDRMREAQQVIAEEGLLVQDRFEQSRAHPAVSVEKDARAHMLQALKALNLDLEPVRDSIGRPPASGGG